MDCWIGRCGDASCLHAGKRRLELGNLDPRRDFIHVRDMAEAIVASTLACSQGITCYNIGSGVQYSVMDVVQVCEKILGEKIEVVQRQDLIRKVERPSLLAGISPLKKACNWEPKIDLEATLRELIER